MDHSLGLASGRPHCRSIFDFLQQDGLILRVAAVSTGQIFSPCLLHSRLSWQKGKALVFREALQYCLPKTLYVPAADILAPSPAHFVQQVRAEGADAALPDMPAPQAQRDITFLLSDSSNRTM